MLWLVQQVETRMKDVKAKDEQDKQNIRIRLVKNSRLTFNTIFESLDLTKEEMDEELT